MRYESLHYKTFDLLKVDHKMLAVSYEFTSWNNSRKWVIDRDWKDIEAAIWEYISHKKYMDIGHKESVDVAGDIQLEITTEACPSYLSKFFEVSSQILSDHILSIFVRHGRLQEKEEEAKAQKNKIVSRKLTLEAVLPRQEEARDLLCLTNTGLDVKLRETTDREGAVEKTFMGEKRKKIVFSGWLKPL